MTGKHSGGTIGQHMTVVRYVTDCKGNDLQHDAIQFVEFWSVAKNGSITTIGGGVDHWAGNNPLHTCGFFEFVGTAVFAQTAAPHNAKLGNQGGHPASGHIPSIPLPGWTVVGPPQPKPQNPGVFPTAGASNVEHRGWRIDWKCCP